MKKTIVMLLVIGLILLGIQPSVACQQAEKSKPRLFRGMHNHVSVSAEDVQPQVSLDELSVPAMIMIVPPQENCPFAKEEMHYHKLLREIAESDLSQEVRRTLTAQAEEGHFLARKQTQERLLLAQKHACELAPYRQEFDQSKRAKKIFKKMKKM